MTPLKDPRDPQATPVPAAALPQPPVLARWAQEYAEDLRRFLAKRRVVESDIKDVCQEVFLRLLRFERAEVVKNPAAYLFRVASNVAHDFKLRRPDWASLEEDGVDIPESEPNPEERAEITYRHQRLYQALESLPPLPRAALILQAQEDLTYEAIAAKLGTTRRAVKRAVARGHELMRAALAKSL